MLKKNPRQDRQDDLFRPRLENIIDPRHELVKLAALIDWDGLETDFTVLGPVALPGRYV